MASALSRLVRLSILRAPRRSPLTPSSVPGNTVTACRTAVCSSSGAMLPKPRKVSLILVPFLYVGTQISKNFAALLEEHDIFVPEDDDDDD
uniref:Essential MCU regulator, mitochondrial n=1 Tax=Maylandia zebra TaxID=106582 RepID=A0A3P9BAF4_9CICH